MPFDLSAEVFGNVVNALGRGSAAELAPEWSSDEIYAYMDDELKKIAREHGLFVETLLNVATTPPQAEYSLPDDQLAVVHADWNGSVLRSMTVREAEMLDANWTATTGAAALRWLSDVGVDAIRLYPNPTAAGALNTIYMGAPTVTAEATTVTGLCSGVADLLGLAAIGECRRRESDEQMPEAAGVADAIAALYRTAIAAYWGGGE